MNKEESLTFLQNCMEKLKNMSEQDVHFFKDAYRKDCVHATGSMDFNFVFPTNEVLFNYDIKNEFDLDVCDLENNQKTKIQLDYSFLSESQLNQQNGDNLPYAA